MIFSRYNCVEEAVPFVTITVKVDDPASIGVPEIMLVVPVAAVSSAKPLGKVPEAMLHVKGPLAVVDAVNVCA